MSAQVCGLARDQHRRAINTVGEQAFALLPEQVWATALRQDGGPHEITDGERLS